jgi:hypothetical protein
MQPDTKHLRAKVEKTRCVHAAQPLEPGQAHTTCAESRPQTNVHNHIAILQPSFKRYKTPDREHVQGDGTTTVNKQTCDCKQHRLARLQAMLHASAARRRHAQAPSYHSEPRVWGPRSSSSCTCICITNHFFSLTDTAASASAILLQQQPSNCSSSRCAAAVQRSSQG